MDAHLYIKNETTSDAIEKIIGGYEVNIENYPYQVSLWAGPYFCGGSIISPSHILTAAHCVENQSPYQVTVRSGSTNPKSGGVVSRVSQVIIHERYSADATSSEMYDIAILVLQNPLKYNSYTRGIPLASRYPKSGDKLIVSGWGCTDFDGGHVQSNLRATRIEVTYNEHGCSSGAKIVCAKSTSGSSTCNGDSGGPLAIDGELVGIVSGRKLGFVWFSGFTRLNFATSVAYFRDWIARKTSNYQGPQDYGQIPEQPDGKPDKYGDLVDRVADLIGQFLG